MNTEPSHLSRTLLPFATMLLSVCIAPSARADRAENAFVTVRAVGAGVTRVDGRNFSANEDGEVEIEAQPGWTLLTPSRVRVTKGQSPHYQVRSSGGEQTGGGDIWRTVTERVRVHVQDPALTAALDAGGPYVYAAPSNGVWVAVSGSATGTPGLHVWEVRTTVYKNGEVVDTSAEIEPGDPFPLELDRWKWTWSPGAPGETNVQSFVSEPVLLPKGTYTASGTAEAWSSQCPDCHASKPASEPFVVSLLTISCNPWIGQDRTGDPAASYTSPKVTATASLEPENPDVKKVTWGGVNKCEKRDPQDWSITLWTEDREKASDTYLGEKVTASVAGATATTNFTIVKVDVELNSLSEFDEFFVGAIVPLYEQLEDQSLGVVDRYNVTVSPELPLEEEIQIEIGIGTNRRFSSSRRKTTRKSQTSTTLSGYVQGLSPSRTLRDQEILASHSNSKAKDSSKFTVPLISLKAVSEIPKPQQRKCFGVGENIVAVIEPSDLADDWDLSQNCLFTNWDGTKAEFYATDQSGSATIRCKSNNRWFALSFTIIEPTGWKSAVIHPRQTFDDGISGAEAYLDPVIIAPGSVSFSNVEMMELPGPATNIRGYYRHFDPIIFRHAIPFAGRFVRLGENNNFFDRIRHETPVSEEFDWEDNSGFDWNIPVRWHIVQLKSRLHELSGGWKQEIFLDSTGTVSISKFGQTVKRGIHETNNKGN